MRKRVKAYEEALHFSTERRFADAVELLDSVLIVDPQDGPSLRLRELCRGWINKPPPDEWDGVTLFAEK